jgi:hypothetical protein
MIVYEQKVSRFFFVYSVDLSEVLLTPSTKQENIFSNYKNISD